MFQILLYYYYFIEKEGFFSSQYFLCLPFLFRILDNKKRKHNDDDNNEISYSRDVVPKMASREWSKNRVRVSQHLGIYLKYVGIKVITVNRAVEL